MPKSLTLRVSLSHTHFLGLAASQEHAARGLPGSGHSALKSLSVRHVLLCCPLSLPHQAVQGTVSGAGKMSPGSWVSIDPQGLQLLGNADCFWASWLLLGCRKYGRFLSCSLKKLLECKFFSSMLTSTYLPHHSFPDAVEHMPTRSRMHVTLQEEEGEYCVCFLSTASQGIPLLTQVLKFHFQPLLSI